MKTTTKKHGNDIARMGALTALAAALGMLILMAGCSMRKAANEGITDAEITAGVKARLAAEPRFEAYALQVETTDGVVHLSGNVGTGGDRDAAETLARDSRGVVSVDNYIQFGARAPIVAH